MSYESRFCVMKGVGMRWYVIVTLLLLAGNSLTAQNLTDEQKAELDFAKQVLKDAKILQDSQTLLDFFRSRTPDPDEQKGLTALIKDLGDDVYRVRIQAFEKLMKSGQQATPYLNEALRSRDPEVVRRAELCLDYITDKGDKDAPIISAAATLLANQRAAGAISALVGFLPFASNEESVLAIRRALVQIAKNEIKIDPALEKALNDEDFLSRRIAAAEALAYIEAGRPLAIGALQDKSRSVQLAAAKALTLEEESEGVAKLITLVSELPVDSAWQAEDLLRQLAGENAPNIFVEDAASAKKARIAWQKWWDGLEPQQRLVRLKKLGEAPSLLNYTLLTQMDARGTNGSVLEMGPGKKTRWEIQNLRYPVDAEVIGPNRVLIAEYMARQVTERDFNGKILWSKQCDLPISVQRLRNGQTFIASRRNVQVVDRTGKTINSRNISTSISAAARFPNGDVGVITSTGQFQRMTMDGKTVKTFQAGRVYTLGGNIEILKSGNILVPQYQDNKVVEYTPNGKKVWEARVTYPTSATRLHNGNTLLVSMTQRKIIELNRQGKVVWEHQVAGRPWCVGRR